jgi:formate dehydrogenase subunit gamma
MRPRLTSLGLTVLIVAMAAASAVAQTAREPSAPTGADAIARSVTEQQILEQFGRAQGDVGIPDRKAAVLEQPQGRRYQNYHERALPWIGGVLILGMIVALAAFYLRVGPINDTPQSGIKIKRFAFIERFTHWMTAASFIVLAITGLNYVFGKWVLFPIIGPDAFSTWSVWGKVAHNAFAWPFLLGILMMILLWVRDNIPDRYDWEWLRQFGGFLSHRHPPAGRFNAGQKMVFWSVAIGGLLLVLSGLVLLFPFWLLDINGMQLTQYVHGTLGMIMIAIILAHIYIGTIGMKNAIDAMETGKVDLAWAKAHHPLWVEAELAHSPEGSQVGAAAE